MRQFLIIVFVASFSLSSGLKNVLFLVSDDMRPEIKAYNNMGSSFYPNMHTPHLDALAARSLVLKRAYVQQAVCGPSRTSLLTGRRPDTTHVYDIVTYWREASGNFTTIPQYFKEQGYVTAGMGKIMHPGSASGNDDPPSWTRDYFHGVKNFEGKANSWRAIQDSRLATTKLVDEQIADHAIETLKNVSADAIAGVQPFFLAVGFQKPHLPFVFPESMLDYYPEDSIELPTNPYVPENMPSVAWNGYAEIRAFNDMAAYTGDFNSTLPDDKVKELRRAYYASISWVDLQIGRVLQALEDEGLENDTIVAFWGDHGWQLGEHAEWCKSTNFELATRAPMMIHIPGATDCGIDTEQLTEFVDLFPTLVDAAGLPSLDQCGADTVTDELCSEGTSLLPLIVTPDQPVKTGAFSQFPRRNDRIMGYSLRTDEYRYTEWVEFDIATYEPNWNDRRIDRELYDHRTDSEETVNLVDSLPTVAAALSQQLRDGWKNAMVATK